MANYGWDCVTDTFRMPIAGGTVYTRGFTVPKGTRAITFIIPALVGTGASVLLEALSPVPGDKTSDAWSAVSAMMTDGTFVAVDGILESTATTVPVTMTGGGVLRLKASEDQSGTPSTIYVVFHLDG